MGFKGRDYWSLLLTSGAGRRVVVKGHAQDRVPIERHWWGAKLPHVAHGQQASDVIQEHLDPS